MLLPLSLWNCRGFMNVGVAFRKELSNICDSLMDIDDPNAIVHQYNQLLSHSLDSHAPEQHKTMVICPKVP